MPPVIDLAAIRAARAAASTVVAEAEQLRLAHDLASGALRGFLAALEERAPAATDVGAWALLGEVLDCLAEQHGATAADIIDRVQERVSLAPLPGQPAAAAPLPAELRGYDDASGWRMEIVADSLEDGRALAARLGVVPVPAIRLRYG